MKRNLLFYLYPAKGSCWLWHFQQLRQYADIFNGKRVVVIAQDAGTVSADEVRAATAFLSPRFVEVQNDPVLCEVPHFHSQLAQFESKDPGEALFYAHGKGVRHTYFLENVLAWAECMYRLNLSSPALIDQLMQTYHSVGAFRNQGSHGGGNWHFSGTFFWMRHDALFSMDWKLPHYDRYGVEGFPGRGTPIDRSFCLTPAIDHGNLYQRRLPPESSQQWLVDLKARFSVT
jgi:hypothetical protein